MQAFGRLLRQLLHQQGEATVLPQRLAVHRAVRQRGHEAQGPGAHLGRLLAQELEQHGDGLRGCGWGQRRLCGLDAGHRQLAWR